MKNNIITKYFFVFSFIVVLIVSFMIFKPFLNAVLAGCIIAYVFFPIYKRVQKLFKLKSLSAFLVSILIIIIVATPIIFMLNSVYIEANYGYVRFKQQLTTGRLLGLECPDGVTSWPCKIQFKVNSLLENDQFRFYLQDTLDKGSGWLLDTIGNFLFSIPVIALSVFIAFFTSFYLFKDGPNLIENLKCLMPFTKKNQTKIFKKFDDTLYAVIYGSIIIAIIQGILATIGYYVVGLSAPVLWGLLTAVSALLPLIGTPLIWLPASLMLIFQGYSTGDTNILWKGVGLLLYGILVISTIDNLLKPRIIGKRSNIHPVFILIGVLGGVIYFGFIGLIIGPVIFGLLLTFLEMYKEELQ